MNDLQPPAAGGAQRIIDLKNINKAFGQKVILKDLNLYVNKGEFITILGPSGCGKTTLLRILAGFVQPDEGEVIINGNVMNDIPPHLRPVNTVFQRYALFPHLNVFENVAFGLKLKHTPEDEIESRVTKALKIVDMAEYEERDVDSLSGGQQQRVAIARAIVNQPTVLLLDEPLSALDAKLRKDMQIELREMHEKLGVTFLFVTHDQEEALTLSDTIVVMNDGVIQQIGTPIDIYNEPVNCFVANFIGDSNIFNGTMIRDRKVSFLGHEFDCVDEGFGENTPVDIVVRPEDVYIMPAPHKAAMFEGTVKSLIFKGVHYEMFVDTDEGYEVQVQDYAPFEVGSRVAMFVKPDDIQVMHKEHLDNTLDATVVDENHIEMLGTTIECPTCGLEGDVKASFGFSDVEICDELENGDVIGDIRLVIYKGNHYHLSIMTRDTREMVYVDTTYVYDDKDIVGLKFKNITLTPCKD